MIIQRYIIGIRIEEQILIQRAIGELGRDTSAIGKEFDASCVSSRFDVEGLLR